MTLNLSPKWTCTLLLGLLPWVSPLGYADDRVVPLQGAAATGTIQELTRDNISIQVRGNTQNFATNAISWVVFDGEPNFFVRAKEFVSKGQFEEAQLELRKVDPASLKSDPSKKDLEFYRAYVEGKLATTGKGDPGKGVKGVLAYATANPQSHHFYDCMELLGELAVQLGYFDKATTYFGAMGKAPFREIALRSRYLEAKALCSQNKFAEAKKGCGEVISAQANDPAAVKIQRLAAVLLARCDANDNKAEPALASLTKLIQENDSTDAELFARIYNAQGECLLKLNRNEEAALAFLHTDLLFSSQPDSHAEALYYLSQLWGKLGDAQRAAEAKEKLTTSYAGSAWAKK